MKARIRVRILVAGTLLAVGISQLCAATIFVTNTSDSGPGSLRDALASAAGGDTINFSVVGTITLTSGEFLVTNSVNIIGPGPSLLAVNGNAASRVFHIIPSNAVVISGLTITNGWVWHSPEPAIGGGIYNEDSTLTVSNCAISGNWTPNSGGGIYNRAGRHGATLTIANCIISGNRARNGGGIVNGGFRGNATLKIVNSILTGNVGYNVGGGIDNEAGFSSVSTTGTVQIVNSAFTDNRAYIGGGICNSSSGGSELVTITNSTLSGNTAFWGGAIDNFGTVIVSACTLSDNSASSGGGGILNDGYGGSATVEIDNTILNAGASGGNLANYSITESGPIISRGYNVSSDDGSGFLTAVGDQINTDPVLGPLQDNGGPTLTHALLPSSPAIDQGKNFSELATDQRGLPRTVDDACVDNTTSGDGADIGAFELQTAAPVLNALSTAKVWLGLKNSDDVGTKFDLLAEVLVDGVVISSNQLNNVPGGSSGFNNAVLRTINESLAGAVAICPGQQLSLRLSVRIAVGVSGHRSGTARLWFNDAAANSRLDATIDAAPVSFYLRDSFVLGTSPGVGPKKTIDVFVDRLKDGNAFKPFGTWKVTY